MADKQLAKFRTDKDNLYRVRWFGYGSGVASVLEKYNGSEWKRIEKIEEGKGSPGERVFDKSLNTDEKIILRKMKGKVRDIYNEEVEEKVEGAVMRKS